MRPERLGDEGGAVKGSLTGNSGDSVVLSLLEGGGDTGAWAPGWIKGEGIRGS